MLLIFRFRHHLNTFTNTLGLPFIGNITENDFCKVETHYHGNNIYHCIVGENIDKSNLPVQYDKSYRFGSEKMNSVDQLQKKLGIRLDARQRNKIRTLIFDQEADGGDVVEILGSFLSVLEHQARNERGAQERRSRVTQEDEEEIGFGFDFSHSSQARNEPVRNGKVKVTKRIRSDTCVICLDNPSDITFAECGHESCCEECAMKVECCPLCRKKTKTLIK